MKKTVTIFFLFVYTLTATEVHQLFKLPVIFEHYQEHQELNNNLGFITYLYTHYMNNNLMDGDVNDDNRDMELPFKASRDCITSVAPVTIHEIHSELQPPQDYILPNDFPNEHDSFFDSAFLSAIFQPPRA